ncbi:unnamed protein product [Calicophoron daubneyi]|uniref:PHD-type domain-containing protein n=1 Tax=Calicophoron daubneyi TaxID=300641 RepID=A0AAV2TLY2_CALDB
MMKANSFLRNKMPLLSDFKLSGSVAGLSVSTGLPQMSCTNPCDSCDTSPPPPALSPASSSPTHLANSLFNQTASPSPPVIVAEINSHSSESSRAPSEGKKYCHPSLISVPDNLPDQRRLPRYAGTGYMMNNASIASRISSSLSSSSSSSSSTSSSSAVNYCGETAANGLPILEKISIALGSPHKSLTEPIPASRVDEAKITESEGVSATSERAYPDPTESQKTPLRATDVAQPVFSSAVNSFKETQSDGVISKAASAGDDKPARRKRPTPRGSARKTTSAKRKCKARRKVYSDSDSEPIVLCQGRSRGRSDAAASIRRVRQTVRGGRSSTRADRSGTAPVHSSAEAGNRRYLESPFLCLCQSGGTVSNISRLSELFSQPRSALSSVSTTDNGVSNESVEAAALPAHIISPALRGFTGQHLNSNSSTSQFSIPPSCPLHATLQGAESTTAEKSVNLAETRSIFSGITYRPSLPSKSRDFKVSPELTTDSPWLCCFCGRDSSFFELGSLYGPYRISEAELAQLPPETVASPPPTRPPLDSSPASSSSHATHSTGRSSKAFRSGIITSTVTRSAAAQGRTTVANMGALRLVIKAPKPNCTSPVTTVHKPSDHPRVGANGAVWSHLECILWAPGTYIIGDGNIGGLGEALQLALDAVCSYCDKRGAILSCCSRGCNLSYHFYCALRADCQFNQDQYTVLCKKHSI